VLAIAKSMSRFRQGSKVLLLPPRPRPSPAALIAGREQFRHVKGQVAKRELWYADIQGDVSGESNPIATSAQFVAVAWRATGGGRCFPPPIRRVSDRVRGRCFSHPPYQPLLLRRSVGVLPLDNPGKRMGTVPMIHAHSARVCAHPLSWPLA